METSAPRVVVVGGAVLDQKLRTRRAPVLGTSNPGEAVAGVGGVGRNIAENLARLGTSTVLVAPVGDDLPGESVVGRTARGGPGRLGCLLRRLAGEGLLRAGSARNAGLAPGTEPAGGIARRADRRAEIHQRLREIARPLRWQHCQHAHANQRLGTGHQLLDGEEPRHDALDIAVDGGRWPVKGNRGDRAGRIGADAR